MTAIGSTHALAENGQGRPSAFNPAVHVMRAVGIVLVVLWHAFDQYPDEVRNLAAVLTAKPIIASFHMPLFFFLSGFLGRRIFRCSQGQYLSLLGRQARRLLTVYLFCSVLIIPLKILLAAHVERPLGVVEGIRDVLLYPERHPMPPLWFLPVLFLVQAAFLTAARVGLFRRHGAVKSIVLMVVLLAAHEYARRYPTELLAGTTTMLYAVYFYLGFQVSRLGHEAVQGAVTRWRFALLLLPVTWLAFFALRRVPAVDVVYGLIGIAFTWALATILVRSGSAPMRRGLVVLGDYAYPI